MKRGSREKQKKMNGIDEQDIYIGLMDRQLQHPFTAKITLTNGRFNSREEVYVFSIKRREYKKLEQIRGGYNFEFRRGEYSCSIVDLRTNQVRLRIEELNEERIEEGAIKVDTSNIIKREKWGLQQLREDDFLDKRLLLFRAREFSGGTQSECIFEENLNREQKQAVEYAVGVRDVYLIWGPPGTGKTTIVPEIVRNYIRLHENSNPILVCSYTNRAVDNVVKKLFNRFSIVRFGDSTLSEDRRYKDALFEEQLKKKRKSIEEEVVEKLRRLILPLEREKEEKEGKLNSNYREREQTEEEKERIKSEIENLDTEIEYIKKQISEKERSLLKIHLEKEIERIDRDLQNHREKLNNLQTRERETKEGVKTIESHIRRLNDNISENERRLHEAKEKEKEIGDIIYIIIRYLKFKKKNKISAFLERRRFERESLYKKYEREIHELQLPRRSHGELESIRGEKLKEREREQIEIAGLQNDLSGLKQEIIEKKKERRNKEGEISTFTENQRKLSENINGKERKQGKLKAKLDLLAHNRLKYNKEALNLKRENPELHGLYDNLSEKQSAKRQKEVDLKRIERRRSSLFSIIEELRNSVSGINDKIKAMKKKMQQEKEEKIEKAKITVLKENQIIATTNLRAADKLFDNIEFDLVIMDESGAIDLPGAVIPFLKGKKFILLGDPEQLPPILGERTPEVREFIELNPTLRLSIFAKFLRNDYRENQIIMLKSQYRMREEIADFVSSAFYKGLLNTPAEIEIEEKLSACQNNSIISNQYPLICFPRRFWTDYDSNYSAYSFGEIIFIKNIIKKFKEFYGDEIKEHIAIISPYRAQIDRIEEEIPDIECGSVHAFQGHEKSIIIYATTKYWRGGSSDFGYLLEGGASRNLLNVAVSRAKEKLIIIGSRELFDGVKIYRKLYEHIRRVGYVAREHISGYDFTMRCEECGRNMGEFRYMDRYCEECFNLHRLRSFLEEMPRTIQAEDTHLLRSSEEVRIDDWFHRNRDRIGGHEVERRVPVNRLMYCDWFLPRWNIYVEYWGLTNEEWYRRAREVKERQYRQAHLDLRSIEPEDMRNLDEILRYKFRDILERR